MSAPSRARPARRETADPRRDPRGEDVRAGRAGAASLALLAALAAGCKDDAPCACPPGPTAAEVAAELARSPELAAALARSPELSAAVASALAARQPAPEPVVTPRDAGPEPPDGGAGEGEAECRAALALASGGNVVLAVNRYARCEGPAKASARAAIDTAAFRDVANRGCAAKASAMAAARIGATSAMNALRAKRCL